MQIINRGANRPNKSAWKVANAIISGGHQPVEADGVHDQTVSPASNGHVYYRKH
jgi:hypothetical protein